MNTKTKKRINIIDILIVVALLAALICSGFAIIRGIGSFGERVIVSYTVAIDPIDSDFVSKVALGDKLYDYKTSEHIGTVRTISDGQAYKKSYSEGADPRGSAIEGMSVLYVTMTTEASKTDTGYTVGNTLLGIGRTLELRFPNLYCVGECVSIEIIEE